MRAQALLANVEREMRKVDREVTIHALWVELADPTMASPRRRASWCATSAQGTDTIAKMIARWSPASENETGSYIDQVSKWTGIDANARVDMHDPATAQKIISAMAGRESGGVSSNEVQIGVGLALGGVATGPAMPPPMVASGPPAQLAGWGPSAQNGEPDGSSLHVTVDVNHSNPPPGSTVRAKVAGKGVDVSGANVAQANVTGTLP